jgi:hypothetical protein
MRRVVLNAEKLSPDGLHLWRIKNGRESLKMEDLYF